MIRTFIDGTDVSDLTLDGQSKHTLGKPYIATVHLPLDYAGVDDFAGLHMKVVGDDGEFPLADDGIDHHGRILNVSENDDENAGTVELTSYGGDEIWEKRYARDGAGPTPGNFSKPSFITRNSTGPQAMEEVLTQSEDGSDPALGEGPTELELGSFAGGGVDLSGAPTNWPMTVAQIRALFQDTGEVDIVVTPIDTGGNIGRVDGFNGDYGTDRTATVIFEYATGADNVKIIRRTRDMTGLRNKIRYHLGPKYDDQHWRRSIEATNSDLPDPPATAIRAIIGVDAITGATDGGSRAEYLVRQDIRVFDSFGHEADSVPLYWRLWLTDSLLRAQPRTVVHVTPIDNPGPVGFDIGDIIGVGAGTVFRGGFATAGQRVYDRTVSWDTNGNVSIAEIQTSADQEAAG